MQTLSVLSVEDGSIVVAAPTGERFRLPVDAALRARLLASPSPADERRLSPREIQSHVRSGLSAEQVAALTGVPVASIERFVGPVLAERAYIVETALAVRLPPETEGARSRTFGAVMGERLDALAARDVRWSSAKEPGGWILAVRFSADEVQHDARWRFDAKHLRLDADNVEASTLSQQGVPPALTPRLRAIEPTAPVAIVPSAPPEASPAMRRAPEPAASDSSRFDSAAFRFPPLEPARPDDAPAPAVARRRSRPGSAAPAPAPERGDRAQAGSRADRPRTVEPSPPPPDDEEGPEDRDGEVFAPRPAAAPQGGEPFVRRAPRREEASVTPLRSRHAEQAPVEDRPTEPLRRRRERAAGPEGRGVAPAPSQRTDRRAPQPTIPLPPLDVDAGGGEDRAGSAGRARRGRTSMPSWDEIVFGRDESP